jgi:hypothetical protein
MLSMLFLFELIHSSASIKIAPKLTHLCCVSKGEPETDTEHYLFMTRFKNWGTYPFNCHCAGQRVRMVCIFATGDLPLLNSRPELFANKFYLEWEYLTLDCMEELHFNRTRNQLLQIEDGHLNLTIYKALDFVNNHMLPPGYKDSPNHPS